MVGMMFLQACNSGGSSAPAAPTTGTLSGTVTAGNPATALAGVSVIIFDASTSAPTNSTMTTDASGKYSATLNAGSYYAKLYKQGYNPVPESPLQAPVPLTISAGATTTNDKNQVAAPGWKLISMSEDQMGLITIQ